MCDKEKYTIEVSEQFVKVTGTLTIREAFDFLNFFEREGYGILESEEYRTTLCMRKGNAEEERKATINKDTLEYLEEVKKDLSNEQNKNKEVKERVKDLEYLIQKILLDDKEKSEKLKEANQKLQQFKALEKLKNSPEAAEICKMEGPEGEDVSPFSGGTVE